MTMSMPKKLVVTCLSVLLTMLAAHQVLAASGDDKVVRLEMPFETMTVRVNQERSLWVSIAVRVTTTGQDGTEKQVRQWTTSSDRDWPVSWTSSNPEVAEVDGDGRVTGISPGTAVITAESENGHTASCTVTVPSSALTGIELQTSNEATASTNSGERLDATRVRADVESALGGAASGEVPTVSYAERTVISTTALRSAAFSADYLGGQVKLRFQTLDEDGTVLGQLTLSPEDAPDEDYDIRLEVGVGTQSARNAAAMGKSYFSASSAVGVVLSHSGEFGLSVEVAAKADLPADAAIQLYRYESGSYTPVENANARIDQNGYLRFTADRGGTYVALV